ncbi:bifunctional enoyl-CoA hydratase/phosphate acetyltransferase [Vibrio sp. 10N.261.51.F12]|uniref:bifunctional enoyl-CoA hydratase/phosphate acetyltransferase n=1 Tax=Vibrio sp. 10N.261.51.F12 TaxID=3229679 RepID=UPI00354F739E
MYNKDFFIKQAQKFGKKQRMVVAAAHDDATLDAANNAFKEGMADVILVGERALINAAAEKANVDLANFEIIEADGLEATAAAAVTAIAEGKGDLLMKGLIDTSILLKEVLKKEHGLRTGNVLSHAGVLFKEGGDSFHVFTDAAMNIAPTLEQKKGIIKNAVQLAHSVGIEEPKVANLCAKEKPYDKMPATMDAAELQKMNQNGEIEGCIVSGPISLDIAISQYAANLKGCTDAVAGQADILMVPNIEVGNVFAKALQYMAGFSMAGVLLGARIPVVLVSRADGEAEKTVSIALACSVAALSQQKEAAEVSA